MNMRDSNGNPITWQFLIVSGAMFVSIAGGSIWLGALSNQISVNTERLKRLEFLMDEVRQHDANTTARLRPIEERLNRIEAWQTKMKNEK